MVVPGGFRLTSVKSILKAILMYQHSSTYIAKDVVNKTRNKVLKFIWIGKKEKETIPLVK
jgi:hypothetical protein